MFLPLIRTHIKGQKELVKEFCEIKQEIRSHVKKYVRYKADLLELLSTGTRQQIKTKQAEIAAEWQEIHVLVKQKEKTRSLLAKLQNGTI